MTQLHLFSEPEEPLTCLCVDGPLKGEFHTIEHWPYRVPVMQQSSSGARWSNASFPNADDTLSYKVVEYYHQPWYARLPGNDPSAPHRHRYMDFAVSVRGKTPDYALDMLDALIIYFGKDEPSE